MNNIRDLYEAHNVFEKQKTIFKEVHSKLREDKDFTIFQNTKTPKYEIEDVYRGCYLSDDVFLGHSFLIDEEFSFSLAIYEKAILEEVTQITQAENEFGDKKVFSLKDNSKIQFTIDNERCYYFKLDKYWVEEGDVSKKLYDECNEILKLVLKGKKGT
jgi:hypothetical protein